MLLQGHTYIPDFYFPDTRGIQDNEPYAENQKRKLEGYEAERIQERKKLPIMREYLVQDPKELKKKRAGVFLVYKNIRNFMILRGVLAR